MIRWAAPDDPRLKETPGEPFLLTMIQGLAKTAGSGLCRDLWLALAQGEEPAGAFFRTESGLWATLGRSAGPNEAAAFLTTLGNLPGMVDGRLAHRLPGAWEPRLVLEYQGPPPERVPLCIPSAMELAECSLAAGAIPPLARDELYAELHLRVRRGAAQVFLVPDKAGRPAAGASILLGRKNGIIGYLACRPSKQGQGYGTAALSAALLGILERGKVPLLACHEELAPFYTARGFVPAGVVWERTVHTAT